VLERCSRAEWASCAPYRHEGRDDRQRNGWSPGEARSRMGYYLARGGKGSAVPRTPPRQTSYPSYRVKDAPTSYLWPTPLPKHRGGSGRRWMANECWPSASEPQTRSKSTRVPMSECGQSGCALRSRTMVDPARGLSRKTSLFACCRADGRRRGAHNHGNLTAGGRLCALHAASIFPYSPGVGEIADGFRTGRCSRGRGQQADAGGS
jgi:hypothetical protein